MNGSLILGVDHGSGGSVAWLDRGGTLLRVEDMPSLPSGARGRPAIAAALLARMLTEMKPDLAFVEAVGPRPTDGCVAAFAFGESKGCVEAVLATLEIPFERVSPVTWKRHHAIGPGKENKPLALSVAIRKWPHLAQRFARVRDLDRAEAALIGLCGLQRMGGTR